MTVETKITPTSDEKMMAALAHFFGSLAAIIVWAIQKDKSRFVKFQALQALSLDFFVMITTGIIFTCGFGIIFLGAFGFMFAGANNAGAQSESAFLILPMMFPFLTFGCLFPFSFILMILRAVAAISILNGWDYRYPIIGKWLDNFMDK